ncbi:MAG: family 78 glycoside hydrolase catalytic domain, partial [Firmicutes bacterium]|nr:family 78 glycoside hydrolase catalytic domain [Candidatus Colimorpha enterica]
VGYDTQFLEHFDSRVKDGKLLPVCERDGKGIVFADAPLPAVEVYEVRPAKAEKLKNGVFCDFGAEYCGGLKIKARGKSGSKVRILCGEEPADSEERVRFDMRCNCRYEEIWTLDGECEYENYDYKAFRYCSVIAEEEETVIEDVTLVARNGRFDDSASSVKGKNHVLGEVFDLCKRGVKVGAQEAFMDCPSREKGQYTGDATVTSASHIWLTGSAAMLEKVIKDEAMSAALIDDGIMATVCGSYMQEIADYSLQFPIHLLRHYSFTKNKAFLASMLPVAEKMEKHFAVYGREDGLLDGVVDKWNLVDWPDNLRDGYDFPLTKPIGKGAHNVINAFWVGCVRNIEEIKDILGIPYEKRGDKLAEAFNRAFFRPEKGLYADSETSDHCSLPSNVIPCYYGFRPEGYDKPLGDFLISRGLVCGVYMAYFLLKALAGMGRYEDVYDLIVSEDENSWYNMIREGGTTCFEAWGKDKKWNTSLCHPWASAPVPVIYEDLMGINPDGTVGKINMPAKAGKVTVTTPLCGGITVTANGEE